MRTWMLLTALLFFGLSGQAQETATRHIDLSYDSNLGIQPGVGLRWVSPVKDTSIWIWTAGLTVYGTYQGYLNVVPEIGYGLSFPTNAKRWSNAFILGLAYQHRLEVTDIDLDLTTGKSELSRETQTYLGPTLGYQLHCSLGDRLGAFFHVRFFRAFGLGETLPDNAVFAGLGLRYSFSKND